MNHKEHVREKKKKRHRTLETMGAILADAAAASAAASPPKAGAAGPWNYITSTESVEVLLDEVGDFPVMPPRTSSAEPAPPEKPKKVEKPKPRRSKDDDEDLPVVRMFRSENLPGGGAKPQLAQVRRKRQKARVIEEVVLPQLKTA